MPDAPALVRPPSLIADRLVLLVVGDLAALAGMHARLRDNPHGFAVLGTSEAASALRLVRRHRPDLVVCDMHVPGLDGIELLLACRRGFPEVRFILMGDLGPPALEVLSLDGVAFLQKPVESTRLEELIELTLTDQAPEGSADHLQGVSVAGFVQLLAMERLTACLDLAVAGGKVGSLYLRDGELRHAIDGERNGVPAALSLLGLDKADMVLRRGQEAPCTTIRRPLNFLLMEAARLQDEGQGGVRQGASDPRRVEHPGHALTRVRPGR